MSDLVLTEKRDTLYFVTLNRADKRNALTLDMLRAVADAVQSVDNHPEVRAVILHGNGPVFSAGIDVMGLAALRAEAADQNPARWLRRMAEEMQHCLHRIEQTEVPVIAALHGKVMGLGLELALACDLRVGTEDVQLSLPETRLGLIADVGGTTRLTKLIGPSRTKELLMTARVVAASEALAWGLLNRVSPADGTLNAAMDLAHEIAQNAPLAVSLAKFVVDQGDGLDRYSQMALERLAQSLLIGTEDIGEAMGAFLERRPPEFKGR
ncbi:MAG: enoyl-CoA hydratase/isomerase family protein [Candidatus Hydrogenedentes bacterium]|nr:enoyl-CoA hydratase/isomerase family protein [Candidatus Hydrogenedentota bacterium]